MFEIRSYSLTALASLVLTPLPLVYQEICKKINNRYGNGMAYPLMRPIPMEVAL